MISVVSWAAGPTSAPVIPKTFHNPGTAFSGGGGSGSGYGSAFFDGTGDSLDVGTFTIGTDAFTIENWFQPKFNTNGSDTVFLYDVSSEDIRVTFKNGNIRAQLGSETELSYSIGSLDQNQWYHTALQRDSSGNVNLYHNGIDVGNYSASGQNVSGNTLRIGDKQAGSKEYTGYISNFRIVKGTAVYTSNFTVPTTPLTDISNTKLLTCNTASGTITDASSNNHTVTTNGDTVASGENPFYTSYSFTPPTAPLTAVTGTQLLTAFNPSGAITDSSSNTYTITAHGDARASQNNPFGQDGGYMYFNGVNSYYRATGISSLIPQMETTSATIEFWFQIQQPNNSGYPSTQIAINLDDPTNLSLIHISEPTRPERIAYGGVCL